MSNYKRRTNKYKKQKNITKNKRKNFIFYRYIFAIIFLLLILYLNLFTNGEILEKIDFLINNNTNGKKMDNTNDELSKAIKGNTDIFIDEDIVKKMK